MLGLPMKLKGDIPRNGDGYDERQETFIQNPRREASEDLRYERVVGSA